jgi:flagellar basal body-associated protein FliL
LYTTTTTTTTIIIIIIIIIIMLIVGSLVTTAWRVLRLRMEGSPPGMEGSCEYIE